MTILRPLLVAFCTSLAFAAPSADDLLITQTKAHLTKAKFDLNDGFAKALLSSKDWQHEFLDSGPVDQPSESLQILSALWLADPALATDSIDRSMATACALESPRRKWTIDDVLPRYQYFRDKWDQGLLNIMYRDLSVFERRYLARGVQHTRFNSLSSMQYHNDEVCLPSEKYTGACWYARWILHNPFGDSIHGPLYYAPYMNAWGNYAEIVRNIGGVCGSLSNFGAAAALANGIPAVTMGEPGHCAYAVMTKPGYWQPAYSLSWKRGLHTSFHGGSWGWHILVTTAQQDVKATRKSGDLCRLAKHYAGRNNFTQAIATLKFARQNQPENWDNWSLSVDILERSQLHRASWQSLHQDILNHLLPISGEAAFDLLHKKVYKSVLTPNYPEKTKEVLASAHRALDGWGTGRWDFQRTLKEQLKFFDQDTAAQDRYMADLFALHAEKNVFTADILNLQLERTKNDPQRFQSFIGSISKSLANNSSSNDGDSYKNVITTLARSVLPKAAASGDKATFQAIGKLTAGVFDKQSISPKKFPGILLSSGGTFAIQEPGNRWDDPSRHWGVIEEHGGDFHTNVTPSTATIRLGNYGDLTGIVLVTRGGQLQRLVGAKLQTSIDGKEWTDVHTFTKRSQVHRIDLRGKKISAGYVRVIDEGQPSLHFHKFHVYGDKKN
jgi:hypothetical protein